MTDKKTKQFFKMYKKNQRLFDAIKRDKISNKDRQTVALYLTEIYFRSQHLLKLIEEISKTNINCTKNDLDSLLGNLIDLQTKVYVEMVDWFKTLKKPLWNIINNIPNLKKRKKDEVIAWKIIQSSMKQVDAALKKIKFNEHKDSSKKKK